MSKFGALALALLLLAVPMLPGAVASAAESGRRSSPEAAGALAPARSERAQPARGLRLDIREMSPRIASTDDTTLKLAATVTNTGDRPISDLVARVQSGQRHTGTQQLSRTLTESPAADAGWSTWVEVAGTLNMGESARLSITTSLSDLGLTRPGVYPLLLNVNGTPAYGNPARLAAETVLLPVLDTGGSAQHSGTPPQTSMLWPFAAREPKIVAAPHDGPVVLSDDDLARQLAPGGRLRALVDTAESSRTNPAVFDSLCFAVDPDLLRTVHAMTTGYRVRTPDGDVAGRGQRNAQRWLKDLRSLVANHCVIQLPYAGADLADLTRIESDAGLVADAVSNSANVLELLQLAPRQGVLWTRGDMNASALRNAAEAGTNTMIADPARTKPEDDRPADDSGAGSAAGVRMVTSDPLLTTAFASGDETTSGANTKYLDRGTQNALGALAAHGGADKASSQRPVLIAPPRGWAPRPDDMTVLLDMLARLYQEQALTSAPLDKVLDELGADTGPDSGDYPRPDLPESNTTPISDEEIEALSEVESTAADLFSAMSVDPTRQVEPIDLIQPLHKAVLRAASTGWSSREERAGAIQAAQHQVRALSDQVTVRTPSQPVSLASEASPLPVTLSNGLPVAITVRMQLGNSSGLRPANIEDTPLAADSRVSRLIPTDTLRSGRFIVKVSVTTPGGTKLGPPSRMELVSSELGSVAVVLTATAGAALFLLSGRHIYRRVKTRASKRG